MNDLDKINLKLEAVGVVATHLNARLNTIEAALQVTQEQIRRINLKLDRLPEHCNDDI